MDTREKDAVFNKLYDSYKKPVLRFIYAFVKNIAACEELTHDVFIKVYKKELLFSKLDENAAGSYLFAAARTTALDYLRRERVRDEKMRKAVLAEIDLGVILSESLENYYINGEVLSKLHDVINDFPEQERAVFLESEIEAKQKKEISQDHNISLYKIRKIQEKIKRSIKKKLASYYTNDVA